MVGVPTSLSAQVQGSLAVAGGNASDITGASFAALSLNPALQFQAGRGLVLGLRASGTRYENGQWALGGTGQLSAATLAAPWLRLAVDANAGVTTTSFSYDAVSAEAVPRFDLLAGPVTIFGGFGGAAARFSTLAFSQRPFGPLAGNLNSTYESRQSQGPLFGATVRLTPQFARVAALLTGREDDRWITGQRFTDRAVVLTLAGSPVLLGGRLGHRDGPNEQRTYGGVSLSVALTPQVALAAAAESYPSNPLTGTAAGRSITAGIVLRFGPHRSVPVRVRGVAPAAASSTRLAIAAPDARRVEIAGDWNGWHTQPARPAQNGVWYLDVPLAPGEYRYAFRIDGKEWRIPGGVSAIDDGFGGKAAIVVVK